MKEVIFDYNFDLERTIKQSKTKNNYKGAKEAYIGANYILDNFAKNNLGEYLDVTKKELQKATIKTTEKTNTTITRTDGKKIKRRKVVKYYVMPKKDELQIIRQITEYMIANGKKTMNRTTSYLEQADLIEEGILYDNGELNREHPLVKKLIPKEKKSKKQKATK